jgi:hypothetical protein
MNLKEMRNEAYSLPDVEKTLGKFQENWISPLRTNTNRNLPFLQELPSDLKKNINFEIAKFQTHLNKVKVGQRVNEKLRHYARYLIELKLTDFQGNKLKFRVITNSLLNDDFLNINNTILEVKNFENDVLKLREHYDKINEYLQNNMSLEESLAFLELPHKNHLKILEQTSKKQKVLVQHIGKHFVKLARKLKND